MSAQGVDGLEGKAGLGEGQEVKAKEGAFGALKYMLFCKVMLNLVSSTSVHIPASYLHLFPHQKPEDVNPLLTIKLALKYANMRDVESMCAIARAHQGRNPADFEKVLGDYRDGKTFPLFFFFASSSPSPSPLYSFVPRYLITCFLSQSFPPTEQSACI